jgi:hypothetical protein
MSADADLTYGNFLVVMTRVLSAQLFRWVAMLLAGVIAIGAMVRPDPVRAAVAFLIIMLLSPLWLRREKMPDA